MLGLKILLENELLYFVVGDEIFFFFLFIFLVLGSGFPVSQLIYVIITTTVDWPKSLMIKLWEPRHHGGSELLVPLRVSHTECFAFSDFPVAQSSSLETQVPQTQMLLDSRYGWVLCHSHAADATSFCSATPSKREVRALQTEAAVLQEPQNWLGVRALKHAELCWCAQKAQLAILPSFSQLMAYGLTVLCYTLSEKVISQVELKNYWIIDAF